MAVTKEEIFEKLQSALNETFEIAPEKITRDQGQDRPGNHDASGAEHGQDIKNGDTSRDQEGVGNLENRQADGNLGEGDEQDQRIGKDAFDQRAADIFPDFKHNSAAALRKLPQDELRNLRIVDGHEKGHNDGNDQIQKRAGNGGCQ